MGARPSDKLPELLTAKEVAASLKLHEATVVRLARSGVLPAIKVGREWRFRVDDMRLWLEVRNETPAEFAKRMGELLNRMGKQMEEAGVTEEDIQRVVEEVRNERRGRARKAQARA